MNQGRISTKMNLDWKFFRGEEPGAWYKGFKDAGWQTVTLPHDWSVSEPFSREHSSGTGYLPGGIGWYRKTFFLPEEARGKKIYITFGGIYNNSQVWCNSYYIGKRPYGYSTFTYDITDFSAFGETANVISVKVNHRDIADSRWFTGSGIYRDVHLTITDPIHFEQYGVQVTTPEVSPETASILIKSRIANETGSDAEVRIHTTLLDADGSIAAQTQATMSLQPVGGATVIQELQIEDPRLWSPETPYLYTVLTEIVKNGKTIDQVKIPTGIRWFEFDPDRGFFLNGRNRKIKGVCIHHDAGCLGAAVPKKVWSRRLKDLKEMGCNAIRTSHNPPDVNLLELCDEMGFLVMDEAFDEWEGVKNKWSTGHNVYPPKHYGYYEDFPQWGETDIKEMVLRDRNHPSIIIWSIGNEVDYPNDPYCHPAFGCTTGNNDANKPEAERAYDRDKPNAERLVTIGKRLVKYVKECDASRPVTVAAAFPELSNLTGFSDVPDITGYNYKEHLYKEDHLKFPKRVIYGSENSSSLEAWLAVSDNEFISGQFIWTGLDFLGECKGWPIRASQAGLIDLAGYPKTGYYYRRSLWSDDPAIYLAFRRKDGGEPEDSRRWNFGEPHWNWKPGDKLEAFCYTNCEKVELFINGRSKGSKKLQDSPRHCLMWEVDFEEGTVSTAAKWNGENISFELSSTSAPQKLVMQADAAGLMADGQDIAHIDIQVADSLGRLVYLADDLITLSAEGPGDIIGMENGNVADLEPYSSRQRKAYHGRLLAYLRSSTMPGRIVVKAEAEGLEPAVLIIGSC